MASNEWELCKENVVPLKQGRKIDVLQETLKGEHSKREAKRR